MPHTQTNTQKQTAYPAYSMQQATQEFVRKVGKPKDGANESPVANFLEIVQRATCNGGTVSELDILHCSKSYDIPINVIQSLWKQYVTVMERLGKLTCLNSCYDWDTYLVS